MKNRITDLGCVENKMDDLQSWDVHASGLSLYFMLIDINILEIFHSKLLYINRFKKNKTFFLNFFACYFDGGSGIINSHTVINNVKQSDEKIKLCLALSLLISQQRIQLYGN